MRALRLRPEDSYRVSFACCYTYAGILPHELLVNAGGTAAEISEFWHLASGIWHLVNLPLLSHNNNTMPLRVFTRRHYNVLEAGGTIRGGWRVVGASPGHPPK
jgi:hypothetical protein